MDNLPDMLLNKSWNDAYADAAQEDNAAAFVAQEGIRAAAEGKDLRLALDTAYSTAAAELRAHLNYLSMIVTLSPLLGLLGTIAGMISSFQIFNLQAGQPMAITGGIGEALIATAAGLCVAIFALVVHTVLRKRWMIFDRYRKSGRHHLFGGQKERHLMRGKRNFHLLSQPEVIIIPMIDIMLFLLVFFMVSTIYMVHLNTLPVNLPAAQAAQSETKPTVVSVTVNKAGHVFYDMDAKPTAGISERVKKTLAESRRPYLLSAGTGIRIMRILQVCLIR